MPRFASLMACLLMAAGWEGVRADDLSPAKDVPELADLQHYAGTWDVELTGNGSGKGEVTAKWILGGRYLEQSGVIHNAGAPDIWITTLYTFDPGKRKYRVWTFTSNGSTGHAEMTWDAGTKVMTSVSPQDMNGIRSTNTADFSTPGKERWHFRYTDRDGRQVGEMSGVNTLRKKTVATPAVGSKEKPGVERSAEDKQLDRFLGTWKTDYRLPKAEWSPDEKSGSATMAFSLELGGKLVRERTKRADGTENTFLMLFDADKKQYRAWWFSSAAAVTGQPNNSIGQWDETAKSFTWKRTDANGLTNTAEHRFVGDKLDWTVLVENPQKVAMFRMEGTSSKVQETKSQVK